MHTHQRSAAAVAVIKLRCLPILALQCKARRQVLRIPNFKTQSLYPKMLKNKLTWLPRINRTMTQNEISFDTPFSRQPYHQALLASAG